MPHGGPFVRCDVYAATPESQCSKAAPPSSVRPLVVTVATVVVVAFIVIVVFVVAFIIVVVVAIVIVIVDGGNIKFFTLFTFHAYVKNSRTVSGCHKNNGITIVPTVQFEQRQVNRMLL